MPPPAIADIQDTLEQLNVQLTALRGDLTGMFTELRTDLAAYKEYTDRELSNVRNRQDTHSTRLRSVEGRAAYLMGGSAVLGLLAGSGVTLLLG